MAQRKSGPVKPPVIDLKARPADKPSAPAEEANPEVVSAPGTEFVAEPTVSESPVTESLTEPVTEFPTEAETAPGAGEDSFRTPPPLPPRPQARLAMPWSAISLAAIAGALLGAGLVYGLGNWLPLPNRAPVIADPTARLDTQDAALADLGARLAAIEEQAKRTQVSLDATISQLDAGLGELRQSVAAVPASQSVDLGPLETQLRELDDRVTAIGAGASSADAAELADTMGTMKQDIDSLKQQLAAVPDQDQELAATVARLQGEIEAMHGATPSTEPAPSAGAASVDPAVRLPLVVSGLETAMANGRPFTAELQSVRALLPELAVPEAVANAAETGLPRPDAVASHLSAAVPDILAGRAASASGDLATDTVEWMKGLLALRPIDEVDGDSPEAVVTRLEQATGRHDFTAAAQLLAALPPAMRAGAGTTEGDIVALAQADAFLAEVRSGALAPAGENAQ